VPSPDRKPKTARRRHRIAEWHKAPKTGDSSFFATGIQTFRPESGFTPKELQATANATCGRSGERNRISGALIEARTPIDRTLAPLPRRGF
jgi:hypothetical protein